MRYFYDRFVFITKVFMKLILLKSYETTNKKGYKNH